MVETKGSASRTCEREVKARPKPLPDSVLKLYRALGEEAYVHALGKEVVEILPGVHGTWVGIEFLDEAEAREFIQEHNFAADVYYPFQLDLSKVKPILVNLIFQENWARYAGPQGDPGE